MARITLTRGCSRTDHILMTYDFDLQSHASCVHGLRAEGQRLVFSEDRVETDGTSQMNRWTDGDSCVTSTFSVTRSVS